MSSSTLGGEFVLPQQGLQLDNLEAELIYQALARTKGNRTQSARLLGITRDALLYRMQKYGLNLQPPKPLSRK